MLESISIKGFKSLRQVTDLRLPRLAVLFGPNAAGKSNFLDALQALSRLGTLRTVSDAIQDPIRGYPIEAFSFPAEGLPGLLSQDSVSFSLGGLLSVTKDKSTTSENYKYTVCVKGDPRSGSLSIADERLDVLSSRGTPRSTPIEQVEGQLRIRRRSKPANPRTERIGLPYTILSDPRWSGAEYRAIERCRRELLDWRTYYLDPRVAMRRATTPADVQDIGVLGENIAPFLYRLRSERAKDFSTVVRTLRTIIPSVDDVAVDLDQRRGTLDITVRQNGTEYSSRIISEGTLRVLRYVRLSSIPGVIRLSPWKSRRMACIREDWNCSLNCCRQNSRAIAKSWLRLIRPSSAASWPVRPRMPRIRKQPRP